MTPCAVCRLATATPHACGACGSAVYCGVACQAEDWKHRGHARQCADLARAKRALPPVHHRLLVAGHRAHCAARGTGGVPALQTDPLPSLWESLPDELLMFMTRDIDSPDDLSALISVLTRPPLVAPLPSLPVQEFAAARVGPTGRGALMEALMRLRVAPLYVPPPGTPVGTPPPSGAWALHRKSLFAEDNTVSWEEAGHMHWPVANIEARLAACYMPPAGVVLRAGWMQDADPNRASDDPDSVQRALGRPATDAERTMVTAIAMAVRKRAFALGTTKKAAKTIAVQAASANAPLVPQTIPYEKTIGRLPHRMPFTPAGRAWLDYAWTLPSLTPDRRYIAPMPEYDASTIGAGAANVGGSIVVHDADHGAFDAVTATAGDVLLQVDAPTLVPGMAPLPALLATRSVTLVGALRDARGLLPALACVVGKLHVSDCVAMTSLGDAFQTLHTVGGDLTLQQNANLPSLDACFPALRRVGTTLAISRNDRCQTLAGCFPTLVRANTIAIRSNDALASLNGVFPALRRLDGDVKLEYNKACASMAGAFPVLRAVKDLDILRNDALANLDGAFGALAHTRGDLMIRSNHTLLRIGTAFGALETVDGTLYVFNNDALYSMARAFPALRTVRGSFAIRENAQLRDMAEAFQMLRSVGARSKVQPVRLHDAFVSLPAEQKRVLENLP
jgi:hypothetical protein